MSLVTEFFSGMIILLMSYLIIRINYFFTKSRVIKYGSHVFLVFLAFQTVSHLLRQFHLIGEEIGDLLVFCSETTIDIFFLCEFTALLHLIFYSLKSGKSRSKPNLSFALFYLSRFVSIFLLIFLPLPVMVVVGLIILLYFNLVPFIWVRLSLSGGYLQQQTLPDIKNRLEILIVDKKISKREVEIIRLILAGKTNSEICEELYISIHTVKNHIYSVFQKLEINSRYQLVKYFTVEKL